MRSVLFACLLLTGCFESQYCDDRTPYIRRGTVVTTAAMGAPAAQLAVEVTAFMQRDTGYDEEESYHSPRCFTQPVHGLSLSARSASDVAPLEDLGDGNYRGTLVGYVASYNVEDANGMAVVGSGVVDMPLAFDPVLDTPSGPDRRLRWTVDPENYGRITLAIQAPDGSVVVDDQTYSNVGSLTVPAARFTQAGTYHLTVTHTADNGYGWERTFSRTVDVTAP